MLAPVRWWVFTATPRDKLLTTAISGATALTLAAVGINVALATGEDTPSLPTGPVAAAPLAPETTPAVDTAALDRARGQLELALLTAQATLAQGQGIAPAEQLAALEAAITTGQAAYTGDDARAMREARDGVQVAETVVRAAIVDHDDQVRAAAEAAAQEQAAQEQAAAQQAAQAPPPAAPPPPPPVVVPADPVAPPPGKTTEQLFTEALTNIGVAPGDVTLSMDWAACNREDRGPNYVQGCTRPAAPTTIVMKPVDPSIAATEIARSVVIHEWTHVLQYRLGYAAVVAATDPIFGAGRGFEESADCMAIALGATGRPGGYTSDCTGARGAAATSLLAGQLP